MNLYSESQVQADQQLITSRFNPYSSQRMWDEIQVYAVPDSFVSAPRFVRLRPKIHSSLPPDSFVSAPRFADRLRIWDFEVSVLFLGWGGTAVEIAFCFCQIRYKFCDFALRLGKLQKEIPDTVSHRSGDFHIEALFRRY